MSPETYSALWVILNRARMLNGWTTRTAKELDATIETWGEMLRQYRIPVTAYTELYSLAFDRRQEVLRDKGDLLTFDATLLVSCWTGKHGLESKLREREIANRRTLTANAESVCRDCDGTGYRLLKEGEQGFDSRYETRRRCDHGNA